MCIIQRHAAALVLVLPEDLLPEPYVDPELMPPLLRHVEESIYRRAMYKEECIYKTAIRIEECIYRRTLQDMHEEKVACIAVVLMAAQNIVHVAIQCCAHWRHVGVHTAGWGVIQS